MCTFVNTVFVRSVWQHGMLFTTRPLDELKQLVPRAIKAKADEKKSNQKDDEDDSKKSKKKTGDNDDDLLRDLPADALLGLVELSWDRRTLHQVCVYVCMCVCVYVCVCV